MDRMLHVDGSQGEGGGQILRSSLALSMVTGRPFTIEGIRAGRKKPGLMRQHLTAVRAAAEICAAETEGAELHGGRLVFRPGEIRPGEYRFAVGSAGSATLILQTVLPPLLTAGAPSRLVLEGGTHNPWAPPFHFLERVFLPVVKRMGPVVTPSLEAWGFYPAGGGRFVVDVEPAPSLAAVEILERGAELGRRARAATSKIPRHVGERELAVLRKRLALAEDDCEVLDVTDSVGPGNVLMFEFVCEGLTELFTGFGERGVRAEAVAERVVRAFRRHLAAGVPVGEHLADQLLLPMAMAGRGRFRTFAPSRHSRTNARVIESFLDREIRFVEEEGGSVLVTVE